MPIGIVTLLKKVLSKEKHLHTCWQTKEKTDFLWAKLPGPNFVNQKVTMALRKAQLNYL